MGLFQLFHGFIHITCFDLYGLTPSSENIELQKENQQQPIQSCNVIQNELKPCVHMESNADNPPHRSSRYLATIQSSSCVTKDLSEPPFNSFLEQVIWSRKDILYFIPLEKSLFISKPWETSESAVILWWWNFEKNSKAWCRDATVTCNNRKRLQDWRQSYQ